MIPVAVSRVSKFSRKLSLDWTLARLVDTDDSIFVFPGSDLTIRDGSDLAQLTEIGLAVAYVLRLEPQLESLEILSHSVVIGYSPVHEWEDLEPIFLGCIANAADLPAGRLVVTKRLRKNGKKDSPSTPNAEPAPDPESGSQSDAA
jgi:hypothetical protein